MQAYFLSFDWKPPASLLKCFDVIINKHRHDMFDNNNDVF